MEEKPIKPEHEHEHKFSMPTTKFHPDNEYHNKKVNEALVSSTFDNNHIIHNKNYKHLFQSNHH